MTVQDTQKEFDRAVALVQGAIRRLGIDPALVQLHPPGEVGRGWSLMRGSAAVAVFLRPPREGEDGPQLRIVAPIVRVDGLSRIVETGSGRRLYFPLPKGATTEVLSCNAGDCSGSALRCEAKFPGRIIGMTVQQRSATEPPAAIYAITGPNAVEVVT